MSQFLLLVSRFPLDSTFEWNVYDSIIRYEIINLRQFQLYVQGHFSGGIHARDGHVRSVEMVGPVSVSVDGDEPA